VITVGPVIPWRVAPQQCCLRFTGQDNIRHKKRTGEENLRKKVESFVCRIVLGDGSLKFDEDRFIHSPRGTQVLLSVKMIWSREMFKKIGKNHQCRRELRRASHGKQ